MADHEERFGQVVEARPGSTGTGANDDTGRRVKSIAIYVSKVRLAIETGGELSAIEGHELMKLIRPCRYRDLVKRLIICHDQMVQTQKRDLIKRVLDSAVGRMLDYKKRIVDLDSSDYQYS